MGCGATKCKNCGVVKKGCKYVGGLCPDCQKKLKTPK